MIDFEIDLPAAEYVPWEPESVYSVDCADLVTDGEIEALFGPVVQTSDMGHSEIRWATDLEPLYPGISEIPAPYYLELLGGIACQWDNGIPSDERTIADGFIGIRIGAHPNAAESWQRLVNLYGDEAEYVGCADDWSYCSSESYRDSTWLHVDVVGLPSDQDALALIATIEERLHATPVRIVPEWPVSVRAVAIGCDLVDMNVVRSALGVEPELTSGMAGGGWSWWAAPRWAADSMQCRWNIAEFEGVGSTQTLPGGEAVWDRITAAGFKAIGSETVELARLSAEDEAWISSRADGGYVLDLVFRGNWIRLTVYGEGNDNGLITHDRRDALTVIAQSIVDDLTS